MNLYEMQRREQKAEMLEATILAYAEDADQLEEIVNGIAILLQTPANPVTRSFFRGVEAVASAAFEDDNLMDSSDETWSRVLARLLPSLDGKPEALVGRTVRQLANALSNLH